MPSATATSGGTNPSSSIALTAFLSGNVTLDDGSELSDPAALQLICHGQRHIVGYTDRHGSFSFQFADPNSGADASDASTTMMTRGASSQEQHDWRDCEVQAVLAGYSSPLIELASRMSNLESTNLGTITLHRLEHVEGTSISVTSMMAPNSAKKALAKAREEEQKGKWDQAQKSLEKAVQIYPKFAVAWCELGRVQMWQNDLLAARNSFDQSIAADSKYVNAYDGLAQLAYRANRWPQVVEVTNKLLALNPVNFPNAYFFNGVANYYLGDFDAAEKSTRQGIRVDAAHQMPKLQYLLGLVLIRKGEYREASELIQQYINLTREPSEVQEARRQLAEIERLSGRASSAAAQEKK